MYIYIIVHLVRRGARVCVRARVRACACVREFVSARACVCVWGGGGGGGGGGVFARARGGGVRGIHYDHNYNHSVLMYTLLLILSRAVRSPLIGEIRHCRNNR